MHKAQVLYCGVTEKAAEPHPDSVSKNSAGKKLAMVVAGSMAIAKDR